MSEEWQPVMPFVAVTSQGGPFDDQAFTAGFQCGQLWQLLHVERPEAVSLSVYRDLERQVDLIAMAAGYTCLFARGYRTEDGWLSIDLRRIPQ